MTFLIIAFAERVFYDILLSMPITLQAAKKLRRDRRRTVQTKKIRETIRTVVKSMRAKPSAKALHNTFQILDKASKLRVIHRNKAARLKSRLSKLLLKK